MRRGKTARPQAIAREQLKKRGTGVGRPPTARAAAEAKPKAKPGRKPKAAATPSGGGMMSKVWKTLAGGADADEETSSDSDDSSDE